MAQKLNETLAQLVKQACKGFRQFLKTKTIIRKRMTKRKQQS